MAKRFGLLRELLPAARRIAVLVNPLNATSQSQIDDANAAARTIGLQIEVFKADDGTAIDKAFATLMQSRTDALLIGPDAMFNNRRDQIAALSVRHRLPTIFSFRTDAEAGGLMSYGTSLTDAHRLAGVYTGRILKGEKPADLPVQQPTKYELAINIKTAKAWFDRTAVAARHRRRGDRIRVGCLFLADIVAKVFLGWRSKILNAVDAFYARRREGPHRFIQNRSRTSVVALKSDAAAEKSKDQLSRDF